MNKNTFLTALVLSVTVAPALAAPKAKFFYTLSWEGDKAATGFELEVYRGNEKKPIIKKILSFPEYRMELSRPGLYKWRVRELDKERKGPFSELGEFEVQDNLSSQSGALMISPAEKSEIDPNSQTTTFTWNEPQKFWTYKIEIFRPDAKEPVSSQPVSGGKIELPTSTLPDEFSWRIVATSALGTTSPVEQKFTVKKTKPAPVAVPPEEKAPEITEKPADEIIPEEKDTLLVSAATSYDSRTFELDVDGSSDQDIQDNLKGPSYHASVEYIPGRLHRKHSFRGGYSYSRLNDDDKGFEQSELSGEYGRLLRTSEQSSHWAYAGAGMIFVNYLVPQNEIKANIVNATGRYFYQRKLTEKWEFNTSAQVLIPIQASLSIPSFKLNPGLSYYLNQSWKLNALAMVERQSYRPSKVEIDGQDEKATINIPNFGAAIGLTWMK